MTHPCFSSEIVVSLKCFLLSISINSNIHLNIFFSFYEQVKGSNGENFINLFTEKRQLRKEDIWMKS